MEEGLNKSFREYIEQLLEESVKLGLSEFDFWNMTIGEIVRYFKGYKFRQDNERRERANFDYTLAVLIGATTVGQLSKGNKIPTIEEAYPDLFKADEDYQEVKEKKHVDTAVARFLKFAQAHNAKSQSEEKE